MQCCTASYLCHFTWLIFNSKNRFFRTVAHCMSFISWSATYWTHIFSQSWASQISRTITQTMTVIHMCWFLIIFAESAVLKTLRYESCPISLRYFVTYIKFLSFCQFLKFLWETFIWFVWQWLPFYRIVVTTFTTFKFFHLIWE